MRPLPQVILASSYVVCIASSKVEDGWAPLTTASSAHHHSPTGGQTVHSHWSTDGETVSPCLPGPPRPSPIHPPIYALFNMNYLYTMMLPFLPSPWLDTKSLSIIPHLFYARRTNRRFRDKMADCSCSTLDRPQDPREET